MTAFQTEILLAGCIIIDDRERVLLVHRNTPKLTQWELPGGKVEPGESAADTAKRELKEELGVDVRILDELGRITFEQLGKGYKCVWFKAEIAKGVPTVQEAAHDAYQYYDLGRHDIGALGLSPNVQELARQIQNEEIRLR